MSLLGARQALFKFLVNTQLDSGQLLTVCTSIPGSVQCSWAICGAENLSMENCNSIQMFYPLHYLLSHPIRDFNRLHTSTFYILINIETLSRKWFFKKFLVNIYSKQFSYSRSWVGLLYGLPGLIPRTLSSLLSSTRCVSWAQSQLTMTTIWCLLWL